MGSNQTNVGSESIEGVSLFKGNGGLPAVRIARDGLEGELYLHGGHVTHWKPASTEAVLFLSEHTNWNTSKAIRGGVPICFPWFGPKQDEPTAPQHGFARIREWKLERIAEESHGILVEVSTRSDEQTRNLWPFDFVLTHRVVFGSTLRMALTVQNAGNESFDFEEAQHTYFRVRDIREVSIGGLDGILYNDKTDGKSKKNEADIVFRAEIDSAYLDTTNDVVLLDPTLDRRITISKSNSHSTVVWNPWSEKARALTDLGDEEWLKMACIETCNIQKNAVQLAPGESHTMSTEISVSSL